MEKKKIKVNFTDFWSALDKEDNILINLLREKYDVEVSEEPDFVFCSLWGYDYKKYDCIRIYYTGEDTIPDFNNYDYAIGFDFINYRNRYLRIPLYYFTLKDFDKSLDKRTDDELLNRQFCAFVCSNGRHSMDAREVFFNKLSEYKQIDSGGKLFNNVGGRVKDKIEFQKQYKFTMAFENVSSIGYTTEKLIDGYRSGAIPIYWGNPDVAKEFNPKSFVNCHDYKSFDEVVARVKEIDNNDEEYLSMLKEPILRDNKFYGDLSNEKIFEFFDNIIENKQKHRKPNEVTCFDNHTHQINVKLKDKLASWLRNLR